MIEASGVMTRLACPLLDVEPRPYLALCAERLLKAALLAKFRGMPYSWGVARELFTKFWGEKYSEKDGETYWAGVRQAAGIARDITRLANGHQVIQPIEPYSMVLKGHTIEGSYGILRALSGRTVVLSPRDWVSRVRVQPDPESILHYTHLIHFHPEYIPSSVLLFPLTEGRPQSLFFLHPQLILAWAEGIVTSYQGPAYPIPGHHCQRCVSKRCFKVYQAPTMISY